VLREFVCSAAVGSVLERFKPSQVIAPFVLPEYHFCPQLEISSPADKLNERCQLLAHEV
jgi:hypothetical protein